MATVNYSVPDDVKEAFDRTFKNRNKSAIVADLMRRAIAEVEQQQQRRELVHQLTQRRAERPRARNREIRKARESGRS